MARVRRAGAAASPTCRALSPLPCRRQDDAGQHAHRRARAHARRGLCLRPQRSHRPARHSGEVPARPLSPSSRPPCPPPPAVPTAGDDGQLPAARHAVVAPHLRGAPRTVLPLQVRASRAAAPPRAPPASAGATGGVRGRARADAVRRHAPQAVRGHGAGGGPALFASRRADHRPGAWARAPRDSGIDEPRPSPRWARGSADRTR